MDTKYNESDWGWFVDLEKIDPVIYTKYNPLLSTIHEYEHPMPKYMDGYTDLENNDTKGSTETNLYTIYKPPIPTIREYHLQIFMNGRVVQEISIPWSKIEQVILKLNIPWSNVENMCIFVMVFILCSLYKYHAR